LSQFYSRRLCRFAPKLAQKTVPKLARAWQTKPCLNINIFYVYLYKARLE
jgi:hypothetical protein